MKVWLSIGVLFLSWSMNVVANCWIIKNMKGYEARNYNNYAFEDSSMSNRNFHVQIDGIRSKIKFGDGIANKLICDQLSQFSMVCKTSSYTKATIETWVVDEESGNILMTKMSQGYGKLDGVTTLIGNIDGNCEINPFDVFDNYE